MSGNVLDALEGSGATVEKLFTGMTPGRMPVITVTVLRELTSDDLLLLQQERDGPDKAPPLKTVREFDVQKVRARHHAVARHLANGMAEGLVAALTGFDPGTVTLLKNSPAMQELIEHYRLPVDQATMVAMDKLRTVAALAVDEMQERLENKPQEIKMDQLVAVAKLGLDRSGLGPASTTNINTEVKVYDAAALAALDLRARRADKELIIPLDRQKALPSA